MTNHERQPARAAELEPEGALQHHSVGDLELQLQASLDEIRALRTAQAAVALENERLTAEMQRRARYERIVSEITSKVHASTNMDAILRTAIEELGRALDIREGRIHLETSE